MASIFHLKGVKVSAHRLFNLFCREVVAKSGNSTVCSSDCHYSENIDHMRYRHSPDYLPRSQPVQQTNNDDDDDWPIPAITQPEPPLISHNPSVINPHPPSVLSRRSTRVKRPPDRFSPMVQT